MKLNTLIASIACAALPALALAHNHEKLQSPATAAEPASQLVDAEVRKVDKDAAKITLKHGAIKNLDMPPMTMVFRVKDTALLDKLKAGDKIRFEAEKVEGAYTVTRVEAAR
jgi:Cu(I)/Ag(I) efflux system protein CusF